MGTSCGRGPGWPDEMTLTAMGLKRFAHRKRESMSQVSVTPAHEHLDALKEGQKIDSLCSFHVAWKVIFSAFEKCV